MDKEKFYDEYLSALAKPETYFKGLFIEVAGQVRKLSEMPKADGTSEEVYKPWALDSIYRRYGKDMAKDTIIKEMPLFDGETIVPEHLNYRPVIGRYLNTYHPLRYQPMEGGNWHHVERLLHHIFGDQYELGLDYVELLYLKPMQKLPLLLLVSKENNTGKSTFCNFLEKFFGQNVTGVNSDGLKNRFTSTWMNKLVVYVEEKLFDKEEDTDMLKNLVTAFRGQSESKGKDRVEVPLFAKLVMTSNNENNPIVIHEDDTRVWAIRVPQFDKNDPYEPNFLEECEKEIPYFMFSLKNRQLSTEREDRLWFRRDLIITEAWHRIVNYCRSSIEKQTAELMLTIMENCQVEVLRYSSTDLLKLLGLEKIKADRPAIKQLLKERWKMTSPEKGRYDCYLQDFNCSEGFRANSVTGWFYTFQKSFLQKLTI